MNKEILKKIEEIESMYSSCSGRYCVDADKLDEKIKEIKQFLQAEEQKEPEFVKGMIVKKKNVHEDKYKYLMYSKNIERAEPLDWKELAKTIAYFIPDCVKVIRNIHGRLYFMNNKDEDCTRSDGHTYNISIPNPTGKHQEIDIERG